ncbi:DUF5689 domain-containing protein [Taibaiella chishuiensis]|uniref:DUF5689 domain-containing protein n=1 Tax=Taibaiella chishuiensis TaxID=1434707 RepID=A0A2P8D469_9BACT|nr:DUF5689 domain-containing protein [Taibaiella chishuiensis]PSK91992.1 hypothetical protein B0I18_10486 [Taibaiella chishuiensis]
MKQAMFLLIVLPFYLWSCSKAAPDQPPDNSGYDPALPVTHTIVQVQALPAGQQISEDIVISGIVIMDDHSGNYNRKLVIQDSSGGIEVLVDQGELFRDYPIGRRLYIRCRGLFTAAPGQNPQLGYTPDETGILSGIPVVLADQYLVKGNFAGTVAPDTLSIDRLVMPDRARRYLNTLVVLKDIQFSDSELVRSYAQPVMLASATNRMLEDCNNGSISLRSSGYARFQALPVPPGRGMLTAVYTRYNGLAQLYIRDTGDVHFYGPRCGIPPAAELTPIAQVRALAPAVTDSIDLLPVYKIAGVVISDRLGGNVAASGLNLQDGGQGIYLRFNGNPFYYLGDSLVVNITGGKLSRFNGQLQVSNIPLTAVNLVTAGRTAPVRTASIAMIRQHYAEWESTLVKVPGAKVTAGGNYSGYKTLSDSTGTLTLFTLAGALFAPAFVPAQPAAFTGILGSSAQGPLLQLRNSNDVVP